MKSKVLVYLGQNTLFIMSTHLIIFWAMQSIEMYFGWDFYNNTPPGIIKSLVYTIICLAISYPLIKFTNRFFPILVGRTK